MKLIKCKIHNIRSIKDIEISLSDYSVLIGSNNAGKSNIITALRLFYEEGNLKFSKERDFPKLSVDDNESWIELEFQTSDSEQEQLRNEYKNSDNILKVRRYFLSNDSDRIKSNQSNIYAYESGILSENLFYGAKNVSQAKLGNVIYIPSVSKTDDTLKLSGPSPFRDLLNLVMKKAVSQSDSYESLSNSFSEFNERFREESSADGTSINALIENINSELYSWDVKFGVDINSIKPDDIVKNLLSHYLEDILLNGERINATSYGQGLQRHLIYTLIKLSSQYSKTQSKKTKDFNPDYSLILFEEPEAFLHPPQQDILSFSLKKLSEELTQQVIITTHSPRFVCKQILDIPSLINIRRINGYSQTWQLTNQDVQNILDENIGLYRKVCDYKNQQPDETGKIIEEALRYYLCLDSERAALFFAKHVFICEGSSEKGFFEHLLSSEWSDLRENHIYFLDSIGKFNIHRFIALLSGLGISHSVVFDSDEDKGIHKIVNEFISSSKTEFTKSMYCFENDIEDFLGITKPERPDLKPINIIRQHIAGNTNNEKLNKLKTYIIESVNA